MRITALLLMIVLACPVHAADAPDDKASHALAKNGTPRYAADFKHFSYVNPDAPKGSTLRMGTMGTFDSLNPFIVKGIAAGGLQGFIYDSLMEQSMDEPFSVYCLICETVQIAPDKLSMRFTLRPEAKWHDGAPITAQDVVWTFNTIIKDGAPFYRAYYGDVKTVTAEDPRTVTFTFKTAENAELPLIIGQMPVLPKHYWADKKFSETSLTPPLGSGPYKVGAVRAGHSIEYIRDKNYWGRDLAVNRGRFNFDRITLDYYRDGDVAIEAFLAGNYDVREENVARLWANAYKTPAVKSGELRKQEFTHQKPQGMQAFLYNLRRPVFQDPKVREALAYAFDFEWSNKQLAFGAYKRSRSFFSNSELAATGLPQGRELEILEKYRGQIPDRVFDTEYNPPRSDGTGNLRENLRRATEILEQAGYTLGKDGVRVNKDGVRLEFQIIDSNPQFERWILPFIANLKRIGVKATFRVLDSAQHQNRMTTFDYDMTIGTFPQSESPGNEQRDFWTSAKADIEGSRNYLGIKDKVVDEMVEGLIRAQSREDLVAHAHALDRVLQWNFVVIPQWHIDRWRIAWWTKKLQPPEKLSPQSPGIADTWWTAPQ